MLSDNYIVISGPLKKYWKLHLLRLYISYRLNFPRLKNSGVFRLWSKILF